MNILTLTDLRGEIQYAERLAEVCRNAAVEAIVFTGNIASGGARVAEWVTALSKGLRPDYAKPEVRDQEHADVRLYARFLDILGALNLPCYIVPGQLDAPERIFLQASLNHEVVAPTLALVHRSFAPLGSNFVVAGFGGRLTEEKRESVWTVEYPFWEAELGFDFLNRLDQDRLLLFHTPPAGTDLDLHRGKHIGAQVVNTLIKAYHPHFVFCGEALDGQGKTLIGSSLVVNPGPLAEGYYAVLDTREKEVYFGDLR
jgi:Icc-related predicted phosphoesterase